MRYLGIDYGSKRVGVAISDETKTFANPFVVLKNNDDLLLEIEKICKIQDIELLVVGESKNFDQIDNKIMEDIKPFAGLLKSKLNLPVHFHPEFLTSKEAEHIQGKNKMHDASAAALILQSFIDTNKNGK